MPSKKEIERRIKEIKEDLARNPSEEEKKVLKAEWRRLAIAGDSEPTGRFGGRASDKAGARDAGERLNFTSIGARRKITEEQWRTATPEQRRRWVESGAEVPASEVGNVQPRNNYDAQGFSELDNEYNEGTDEYRDEAAEATAQARGYKEDNEQVETGPTRPERLEFVGRFGGRGSDKAGARDASAINYKGYEIRPVPGTNDFRVFKNGREQKNMYSFSLAEAKEGIDFKTGVENVEREEGPVQRGHARDLAMDPPVSQAQRAAMHAAAEGKSTLGIPKSVGQEFANADPGGKLPAKAKDETSRESPSSKEKSEYNEGTSFHGQWRRPPESSENRPPRSPPPLKTNLRSGR